MPEARLPFFSSDGFLDAMVEHYFPGGKPAFVSCEGVRARLVMRHGRAVNGFWHFRSYLQSLPAELAPGAVPVPFLTDVARVTTTMDEPGPAGAVPAPFIRLGDFARWQDYVDFARRRNTGATFATLDKHERRLRREYGATEFKLRDDDPALLETTVGWKNDQLRLRGERNRWAIPHNAAFLARLRALGLMEISSVRVAGKPIAGHLWNQMDGRVTALVTAYDPAFHSFSPGNLMLVRQLREHFEEGVEEYDFLMGNQPQKLAYATHRRWLETLGREPRTQYLRRTARMRASELTFRFPRVYRGLRRAETAAFGALQRVRPR